MPWVITRHWLKALRDTGAEVAVGCPSGPYVPMLEEFGLPVRNLYVARSLNPVQIFRGVLSIRKILKAEHWDIVNFHGAASGFNGRIAAVWNRQPLIVVTNHGYYFDENMNPIRRQLSLWTEWLLGKVTDYAMFISAEDHAAAIKSNLIRNPAKAVIILNGIDLTKFPGRPSAAAVAKARAKLDIPANAQVIGLMGRLIIEKGLREFFAATKQLCSERQNLFVVVVGDALATDRGAWKQQLIYKVKAAGLEERYRFTGFIPDVYPVLSAFDILVHPSYKESFGRVIAEAMATALPVIATNVRGCRELVVPGETGLLVPYRDIPRLIESCSLLLDNHALCRAMGDAGHARVMERYDQQKVIERFVTCINTVAQEISPVAR